MDGGSSLSLIEVYPSPLAKKKDFYQENNEMCCDFMHYDSYFFIKMKFGSDRIASINLSRCRCHHQPLRSTSKSLPLPSSQII